MKISLNVETVGGAFLLTRMARGLSLREVGTETGVTVSVINRIESGKGDAYWATVVKLAKFYGLDMNDLVTLPIFFDSQKGGA